ncbi:cytochrome p450 94a1 [Quercus suber]|uniref:Cytochrome p450 94a1 n=1 Tax=Quercus suber TaxID=58331 RepID=A0AAW0KX00_QUESU
MQKEENSKDSYMYPVFQLGPRICLGKEMAFL